MNGILFILVNKIPQKNNQALKLFRHKFLFFSCKKLNTVIISTFNCKAPTVISNDYTTFQKLNESGKILNYRKHSSGVKWFRGSTVKAQLLTKSSLIVSRQIYINISPLKEVRFDKRLPIVRAGPSQNTQSPKTQGQNTQSSKYPKLKYTMSQNTQD